MLNIRHNIQPKKLKDEGRPIEPEWFDEEQLILIKKNEPKRSK